MKISESELSNTSTLLDAVDVIQSFVQSLGELIPDQALPETDSRYVLAQNAATAMTHCSLAALKITELAYHLKSGKEFDDAMRSTVMEEIPIDPDAAREFETSIQSIRDPMKQN